MDFHEYNELRQSDNSVLFGTLKKSAVDSNPLRLIDVTKWRYFNSDILRTISFSPALKR
jgi:hypothetical protein